MQTQLRMSKKIPLLGTLRRDCVSWLLILPALLLLYIIIWRPTVYGFVLSFFRLKGYTPQKFVGVDNYIHILNDTAFLQTLWNTCQYVFWSLIIGFVPPIIVAIALNEIVHFKGFFKFSVYFPVILPTVAASLIWYFLYQPGEGGIFNMLLSKFGVPPSQWLQNSKITIPLIVLFMSWKGFGGSAILYFASLQGVSQELYEAATLDGATLFIKIKNVMFPHLRGIIMLLLVRQIIAVFQVMVEPMAMTGGGPNNASISLALQGYYYAFTYFQADFALALGVVTFIILLVLTAFYFKIEKKFSD